MVWRKTGVMSGCGDLVVSHLCHNPKCHKYKHLVLKTQEMNQARNDCRDLLKAGQHRFACRHRHNGILVPQAAVSGRRGPKKKKKKKL